MSDIDKIHTFLFKKFNNLVVDENYKLESNILMNPDCDHLVERNNKYNLMKDCKNEPIFHLFSISVRNDNNTSLILSTDFISLMNLTYFFIYEQDFRNLTKEQYFNRYIKLAIEDVYYEYLQEEPFCSNCIIRILIIIGNYKIKMILSIILFFFVVIYLLYNAN